SNISPTPWKWCRATSLHASSSTAAATTATTRRPTTGTACGSWRTSSGETGWATSARHRDAAPDPIRPRQRRMRRSHRIDPLPQVDGDRADPAGLETDMEEHQVLRRAAMPAGEREHLEPAIEPP